MKRFYHGTTQRFELLKSGSWLTEIPNHAIEQAKSRAKKLGKTPYVLVIDTNDTDIRRPTNQDRNSENIANDFIQEDWVWISTTDLKIAETITLSEAESRYCGPRNMLSPM
jgi:hypothetical protein